MRPRAERRTTAVACGAKEYWAKPIDFRALVSLVHDNFQRVLSGQLAVQ